MGAVLEGFLDEDVDCLIIPVDGCTVGESQKVAGVVDWGGVKVHNVFAFLWVWVV